MIEYDVKQPPAHLTMRIPPVKFWRPGALAAVVLQRWAKRHLDGEICYFPGELTWPWKIAIYSEVSHTKNGDFQ